MSTTAAAAAPSAEMSQLERTTISPQSHPETLTQITNSLPPVVSASSEGVSATDQMPLAATIQPQTQTSTPNPNAMPSTDIQRPEPALLPPPAAEDEEDIADGKTDAPTAPAAIVPGAAVHITLLLTTGARHPFTIDQKYLKRRNVGSGGAEMQEETDPFGISVYTMKELIWKDWREGKIMHFRHLVYMLQDGLNQS